MRICTNTGLACNDQSLLRQQSVLNTHRTYIKEILDLVLCRELSDAFTVLCTLDILIWCKVIHYKCNLILIKYFFLIEFVHLMNCYRCCNIISKYKVQICLDQLSGFHAVKSCMCS